MNTNKERSSKIDNLAIDKPQKCMYLFFLFKCVKVVFCCFVYVVCCGL